MFQINKAKFTTNSYGEVDFVNGRIPGLTLPNNPFYMVSGTSYVRVSHPNHGMFTDSVVVIDTGLSSGTIGGVTYTAFEGNFTIVSADIDSYIIDVGTSASYTGSFGGTAVYATENIQYNTVQPIVNQFLFPNTDLTHYIRTTSGKSVDGTETPYQIASEFNAVAINQNNSLVDLQMITTPEVESDSMGGNKSVVLRSRLITQNENVSPAIDMSRLSLITVQDRINSPLESTTNNSSLDTRVVLSANTTIAVTETNKFSTSNSTAKAALLTVMVGKYITTTGFAASANNGKFLVTEVAPDGSYVKVNATLTNVTASPAITISSLERFVDETAPLGGSSLAKYVTKKINLENSSTFLKIRFGADVEQAANIDLYYKIELKNASVNFGTLGYTLATPSKAPIISTDGVFHDVEYDISGLPEFTAVQVKLVSTSTRGADIVRVRDLVIIGCA